MTKEIRPAIVITIVFTILTGFIFPGVVTLAGHALFPRQAEGSLIRQGDKVVGSDLIGQSFTQPRYFHPRPSAAGNGYDPTSSGGTNLGPTSDKLIHGIHKKTADGKDDAGNFDGIQDLAAAYRKENGLAADVAIPSDAVTRSASGLDPDISPANAALQVSRVASARNLPEDLVRKIVEENTEGRQLGFLGEPRVNVLRLNLALDRAAVGPTQ